MKSVVKIRDLDPSSDAEIRLVGQRMRQTLVEVLGEAEGTALYSLEWLEERVRWHLDPRNTRGRVFLSENPQGEITGHGIARIERDESGAPFGYFSTLFVEPKSRRVGIATRLLKEVETWFSQSKMPKVVYNTAKDHVAIIELFSAHGYCITHTESKMVQLTRLLQSGAHDSQPTIATRSESNTAPWRS